jgi:cytochrome bd-type quinol oxidase subunit 1
MGEAVAVDRLHFAFTATFHYIFPQLTMGLALLVLILKTLALWTGQEEYSRAVHFWARIFALNFALGVVTGVPMEFQFGTNWAGFSLASGGVIGQTLAMEGVFSFFLESSFLGLMLFGEKRLGQKLHWVSIFLESRSTVKTVRLGHLPEQLRTARWVRHDRSTHTRYLRSSPGPIRRLRLASRFPFSCGPTGF